MLMLVASGGACGQVESFLEDERCALCKRPDAHASLLISMPISRHGREEEGTEEVAGMLMLIYVEQHVASDR